jgi:hypothetical protein
MPDDFGRWVYDAARMDQQGKRLKKDVLPS